MSENLPANQLPNIPDSKSVFDVEIDNSQPITLEDKPIINVLINDMPISTPTILLNELPSIGNMVNIIGSQTNDIMLGSNKTIRLKYKNNTNDITNYNNNGLLIEKNNPNVCNFTLVYNGNEWQTLDTPLIKNIESANADNQFNANRSYSMIEEYKHSGVSLTFVYQDLLGNKYEGKNISLSANKQSIINPVVQQTDINGEAKFTISCNELGECKVTAVYDELLTEEKKSLYITIDVYEDQSSFSTDKDTVYNGEHATLSFIIQDTDGNKYQNKLTEVLSDQKSDNVTAVQPISDQDGKASYTVSSAEVHQSIITGRSSTDDYTIDQKTINFIDVPPIPPIPTDGLCARFECDNGIVLSGEDITEWKDQISGNSLEFYSSIPMKHNGLTPSGLTALQKTLGCEYRMALSSVPAGITYHTICMVGRFNFNDGSYNEFGIGNFVCYQLLNHIILGGFFGNNTFAFYPDQGCTAAFNVYSLSTDWYIFTAKFSNHNNTAVTQIDQYINGQFFLTQYTDHVAWPTSSALHLHLYGDYGGEIGGLYVYDHPLDEGEMNDLHDYLASKFGISL